MENNINYQLGIYAGEYIVSEFLPSLSCEMMHTRNVIQCTIAEADEQKRLDDIWSYHYNEDNHSVESKESWKVQLAHSKALISKYLPENLRCNLPRVTPNDMESFIEGLRESLWNSDVCSYSLKPEDIRFDNDSNEGGTIITLKLGDE